MLIHVTQEDIDKGVRVSCEECPLARAVSRAYGTPIRVGAELIQFFSSKIDRNSVNLPPEALRFRIAFDKGLPVKPFSFEIPDNDTGNAS